MTMIIHHPSGADRQVFHCHLLRQPAKLRELLLSGLEQSGCTQLPKLRQTQLEPFLAEDAWAAKLSARRGAQVPPPALDLAKGRVLVAVGPESGWQAREAVMLEEL